MSLREEMQLKGWYIGMVPDRSLGELKTKKAFSEAIDAYLSINLFYFLLFFQYCFAD
jgi:hypothetical protein